MTGFLGLMVAGSPGLDPLPGIYSSTGGTTRTFTITSTRSRVWTWSQTQLVGSGGGSANVVSGASAASITFTVALSAGTNRSVRFDVTVDGLTYQITLTCNDSGGGVTVVTL